MPRLPRLRGRELMGALRRAGFMVLRVKGSHHFLQHPDGRRTVIPIHSGETIGPGLLRSTWCRIDSAPDGFTFSGGRGFGHGVGLCQFGADGLGQAGWNYRAILAHYYPSSHITKAY